MADSFALDDGVVRRYLLGRASAQELREVEELYFGNPELFERLEEQDDTLTHEYLGGGLTGAERADFERTLASMPRRRERLALIRELQHRAAQSRESGWRRAMLAVAALVGGRERRPDRRVIGFAIASAILVLSTAWLGREVVRLRGDVRLATLARETAEREATKARDALATERARVESTTTVAAPPTTTASGPTGVLAVTLTPGLLRGPITSLALSDRVLLVRLTLLLPPADASRYQIALRTSSGEERWRQTGLAPRPDGLRRQLPVEIPSTVLEPGQLTLLVTPTGASPGGSEEYHFAVVR